MNPMEVAKRLPLKKFEIYEDLDDHGRLIYSECSNIEDAGAMSDSFNQLFYSQFETIELAFLEATAIYLKGLEGRKSQTVKARFKPKTKIILKEHCRDRDGGSSWADPENDIVKSGQITIDICMDDSDRRQHYTLGFAPYAPFYGIGMAYTTMLRMFESFLPGKSDIENIIAFEWQGQVFNEVYVMPEDLCVAGKIVGSEPEVLGDNHGDDIDDPSVKIDYLQSYVRFHYVNKIYGVGRRFFYNGEVVTTTKELISIFPQADEFSIMSNGFYKCDYVLEWFKEMFPRAVGLDQGGMGHSINFGNRNPPVAIPNV